MNNVEIGAARPHDVTYFTVILDCDCGAVLYVTDFQKALQAIYRCCVFILYSGRASCAAFFWTPKQCAEPPLSNRSAASF